MVKNYQWTLQLQFPSWVQESRVPIAMWDLLRIVTISYDAYIYDLDARGRHTGSSSKRWRVPVQEPAFWTGHAASADLLRILHGYWNIPMRQEFVPPSEMRAVSIRIVSADEVASGGYSAPDNQTDIASNTDTIAYAGTMDGLAAVCQLVGEHHHHLVPVNLYEDRGATSSATMGCFSPDVRQRLHPVTATVCSRKHSLEARRLPLDLLHLLIASTVALGLDKDQVIFPQDGVASLQLPITMMSAGAILSPTVTPAVSAALASLISRIASKDFKIINPLADRTPADTARSILENKSVMEDTFQPISLVEQVSQSRRQQDAAIALLCASEGVTPTTGRETRTQLERHFNQAISDSRVSMFIHNLRELGTLPSAELRERLDILPGVHWLIRHNQYNRVQDLIARHTQEVMTTLTRLVHGASRQLVQGTLPLSSFLGRTLYPPDLEPVRHPTFKRRGDMWVLWFDAGDTVYMEDLLGLRYIHHLLQFPGRSYSAMALRAQAEGQALLLSGSIDVLDEIAIRSLKTYLNTLRKSIEAAEHENRPDKAREHRAELENVEAELNRAVGLGGRVRKTSDMEKARRAVSSTIHRALTRLHESHPALSTHLRNHLHIGAYLRYTPEDDIEWIT